VVEPVTVGVGGLVVAHKLGKGLNRLLGPAADEAAAALARFTEYRLRNVGRVVKNAESKSSAEEGSLPLRVAMRILEEGSYSDEELVVEYLGGVLASSRTPLGRDDRGNTKVSLVARLSTYDLRAHYIWYREFRRLFKGQEINPYDAGRLGGMQIYIPHDGFWNAMDFGDAEDGGDIFNSLSVELAREGLGEVLIAGNVEHLTHHHYVFEDATSSGGMLLAPSLAGMHLYLWALGCGQESATAFFREDLPDFTQVDVPSIDGTRRRIDVQADSEPRANVSHGAREGS
jgi:hypothetical protein